MNRPMNLLPVRFRRRLVFYTRLRVWAAIWALCGAVGVSCCLVQAAHLVSVQAKLAKLEAEADPILKMDEENDAVTSRIRELIGRESILGEVSGVPQPLTLVAVLGQSAAQARGGLQIDRLQIRQLKTDGPAKGNTGGKNPPTAPGAEPASAAHSLEISVRGVAMDDVAVAEFVSALRETGLFAQVELRSSMADHRDQTIVRNYDVVCRR